MISLISWYDFSSRYSRITALSTSDSCRIASYN